MKQNHTVIGGIVLLVIGIIVIGAIYYFVLRTPEEASEPISSIPLELPTETATAVPTEPPTEAPPTETPLPEPTTETPAEPTATPTAVPPTVTPEPTADPGQLLVYEISQEESEVRFSLDEDLRGSRNTVIGITDQIAGQIAANTQDLSTAQVGIIQVNARTLLTDNNFRNNAISNQILDSNTYEFITFTPTAVNGLPDSVAVGDEVTFEIVGDLTIRDITQEATFTVTVTVVAEDRLEGFATTQVLRSDYELIIPEVPGVANVTDEVILEFDLVATVLQP